MKGRPVLKEETPAVDEFIALRDRVGWGKADRHAAQTGLNQGLFSVCLRYQGALVGLGRVVGDGGLYFYLQDIIVHPDFQGRGHGAAIVECCVRYINAHARPGVIAGLFAAQGKAGFYEKWGFFKRPNQAYGPGMCIFF